MKNFIRLCLAASVCLAMAVSACALTPEEAAEMELMSDSGLTAEELAPALGELAPYAEDFLAAERETGVNAVFLASLAAFESGWGRFCRAENNIFGWSGPSFSDKGECIAEISRRIARIYLTFGGACYRGGTLSDVNICYNGSESWFSGMRAMMAQIGTRAGCETPDAEPAVIGLPFDGDPPVPKMLCAVLTRTAAV
mgnify:CR=1 FL=1